MEAISCNAHNRVSQNTDDSDRVFLSLIQRHLMVLGDSHLNFFNSNIISFIGLHHSIDNVIFITARIRTLRRLCFYRCLSVHTGGACVVAPGGGGWGACVVAPRGGVHGFFQGDVRGCSQGGHAWLLGGMRGCSGGCMVAPRGVCMVFPGGHAWLLAGGVHGCSGGDVHGCSRGACVVAPRGGVHGFFWGGGEHAWLLRGVHGCSQGVCMVAPRGACIIFSGGEHA